MGGLKFPVGIAIQAIDDATAKTKAIVSGITKATSPLRRIGTSLQGLSEAAQFPKLLDGFRGVGSAIGELGDAAKRASFLVGGIAVAAAGTTFALVKGFAEAGDSATKGAPKIGIGVEALQELRYAGDLANVASEELDASLIKLTRNAALAARGQASAVKPFERLSISVLDQNGQLRDASSLVSEIADKFGRLDDPLKRAALATELFGKSGANMIPLLLGGSKGLAEAAAEARSLGIVLSADAAAGGEVFMDALTRVSAAIAGVRNAIGAELLPIVLDLANSFRAWITESLPQIRAFAARLAKELPVAIQKVRDGFVELWTKSEPVRRVLGKIYDALGPLGSGLVVLSGILVATLAPAIAGVVSALATLSAAMVATPAGLVVIFLTSIAAGLAVIVGAVIYLYTHWDQLAARFPKTAAIVEKLVKVLKVGLLFVLEQAGKAIEFVAGGLLSIPESIIGSVESAIGVLAGLWDGLKSGFGEAYDWIAGKLAKLVDLVPDWALDLLGVAPQANSPTAAATTSPNVAGTLEGPGRAARSESVVRVDFANLPRGARVSSETRGDGVLPDIGMGYALFSP